MRQDYYEREYADCCVCDEIIYRCDHWDDPDIWVHLDVVRSHLPYPTDDDRRRLEPSPSAAPACEGEAS